MTVSVDSGSYGLSKYGEFLHAGGFAFFGLTPPFSVEIREPASEGGALLATPLGVTDVGYSEAANKAGRMTIELPPDDPAWDFMTYGHEIWLYIKGKLHDIYVIWGDERNH